MRSTSANFVRVAVLGAAGGIGQPLSMLLKSSPLVSELSLYDVRGAPGVAADLSHVCTPAKVSGYGTEDLHRALDGAQLVLIPAGVPRKPGMTRDDLFGTNAGIIRDLAAAVAKSAPKAIVAVIANPLNSLVPVAAATLEKAGVYDPARLMGITTLDLVRGRTFIAEALGKSPYDIQVPVIAGHSGQTIVPVLAQYRQLTQEQVEKITYRIQFGGDEVVKAKAGAGSATLAMAYAGAEFSYGVLKALRGEEGVVEYMYVESPHGKPQCRFFSSEVELCKNGVKKILPLPELNGYEKTLLEKAMPDLESNINKGLEFGRN